MTHLEAAGATQPPYAGLVSRSTGPVFAAEVATARRKHVARTRTSVPTHSASR